MKKFLLFILVTLCLCGCGEEPVDTPSTQTDDVSIEEPTVPPSEETEEIESVEASVPEDMTPAYVQHEYRDVNAKDFNKIEYDPEHLTDEWVRKGMYYEKYAQPDDIVRYEFIREEEYLDEPDAPYELSHHAIQRNGDDKFNPEDWFFIIAFNQLWDELDIQSDIENIGYRTGAPIKAFSWYNEFGSVYAAFLQTEEDLAKGDNVWSFYVGQQHLYDRYIE